VSVHAGEGLFAVCCEPIIQQKKKAATAEQLMRSRYSAYALGHVDWIIESQSPDGRQFVDRNATEQWSKRAKWHKLEVVWACRTVGWTTPRASSTSRPTTRLPARTSRTTRSRASARIDGAWYFVDGIEVKPRPFKHLDRRRSGRTTRARCGSGKKYKKCCGKLV
jgi:SEC-C motif-containing protein